jgi:ABC-2 type transport system permease protein
MIATAPARREVAMAAASPYFAAFSARFALTLQYRAAALAGFATQCWWGAIKVMVLAAFFVGARGHQPMSLANAITYTWLGQAFLIFLPWNADPEVADMVRSGAVAYDRLRPLDTYGWWYARAVAYTTARVVPRAALMFALAAGALPLFGLGRWGLHPPASLAAASLFVLSMSAVALLAASITLLLNIITVATMTDRGASLLVAPFTNLLSGGIVPLAFFPAWIRPTLRLQPFAGLFDTPFRIYFADLGGWGALGGIGLQLGWTLIIVLFGHWALGRALSRLQVQGG